MDVLDISDTPIWMVFKRESGNYRPGLVAWYNVEGKEFLTPTTFGTKHEAQAWLTEFWNAVWRLSL